MLSSGSSTNTTPSFIEFIFLKSCVPLNTICFSPVLRESTGILLPCFSKIIFFSLGSVSSTSLNFIRSKKSLNANSNRYSFDCFLNSSKSILMPFFVILIHSALSCDDKSTSNCFILVKSSLSSSLYLLSSICSVVEDFTIFVLKPERAFEYAIP